MCTPKMQQDLICKADDTLSPTGQRQAMLESMLYQKYRQACTLTCHPPREPCSQGNITLLWMPAPWGETRAEGSKFCSANRNEMLEEICPHQMPMESVSTTHQDYCAESCQFTPLPTTKVTSSGHSPLWHPLESFQGFQVVLTPTAIVMLPVFAAPQLLHGAALQLLAGESPQPACKQPQHPACQHPRNSAADRDLSPLGCHQNLQQ